MKIINKKLKVSIATGVAAICLISFSGVGAADSLSKRNMVDLSVQNLGVTSGEKVTDGGCIQDAGCLDLRHKEEKNNGVSSIGKNQMKTGLFNDGKPVVENGKDGDKRDVNISLINIIKNEKK